MGMRTSGLMRNAGFLKRRGLLAGAAALVGAGLAKIAGPDRVLATHGGGVDSAAVHANEQNFVTEDTSIANVGAGGVGQVTDTGTSHAFCVLASQGGGFDQIGRFGVMGKIGPNNVSIPFLQAQAGVWGVNANTDAAPGVLGETIGTGSGVRGKANGAAGVWGTSAVSYGVLGQTSTGAGVFGDSSSAGGYGVYGRSKSGAGVFGTTTNGYAGSFVGPVVVQGSFTVFGGPKSAAVSHPDGSQRRMYCQESPEPWFEDVGQAKLINGRAEVKLDPDFAAVVKTDDYRIFLTEIGDSGGLFVSGRTPTGFTVQARGAKTTGIGRTDQGDGSFDYRVMARRRDIEGRRLEKVDLRKGAPAIKMPEPFKPED